MNDQTTIKIQKRTHKRLARAAKNHLPKTTAPALGDKLLNEKLDQIDAAKKEGKQ